MRDVSEFPQSDAQEITPPTAIEERHDCSAFACGHEALDDWLRLQALKNEGKTARTFVVTAGARVVGYYCLASGSERRANMPRKIRQGLPDPTPLTIIGRLAVDNAFKGRKVGVGLLQDALRRTLGAAETVGSRAVLVHAIDGNAVAFYARFGFIEFPSDSRTMFLPIETIVAAQ